MNASLEISLDEIREKSEEVGGKNCGALERHAQEEAAGKKMLCGLTFAD